MSWLTELDGDQIRQLINSEQAYQAFRAAMLERGQRFSGSMAWKRVRGREYLYRKTDGTWRSLGPRSEQTERTMDRFQSGREAIRGRIAALDDTIRRMAPVNRAMRLGRVPWVSARLLRKLERKQLLGGAIAVAGTHALFAYERMAGVHFDRSQIATLDIDLLYDARASLRLVAPAARDEGLQGLLRAVDGSFEPIARGSFRAVNATGFMVDLITPLPASPAVAGAPARIGSGDDDMAAAEIEGLAWLQNCPQVQQVAIDERGYPVPLAVPDPRAFALHKLWISERPDRDPVKARRDAMQARSVAGLVLRYLPQLRFDDPALAALPAALRARAGELLAQARQPPGDSEDW